MDIVSAASSAKTLALCAEGDRDGGAEGQSVKRNLFFVVSFRLTHSTSFPLHPYIPNPHIPVPKAPNPLFIRSQFQILIPLLIRKKLKKVSIPYSSGLSFRYNDGFTENQGDCKSQSLIHQVSVSDAITNFI
jgi:hypothetical protein